MENLALYGVTALLLALSFLKNRKKTRQALKKGFKALGNILPQFITVLLFVSAVLALFDTEQISRILGSQSGILGGLIAGLTGAITLIPGFVAFPAAAELLRKGAGIYQVAVFISTLMMVGIITLPMEIQFFGKRTALVRNALSFFYAFAAAAFVSLAVSL